ncbi:gas vesicle protein GvpG [Saccharopolyspora sp. NPDC002686]|uniref:gas vesicle protein GvpG n=1 Tax=Saccharopolyspora sp. NPDC002686 TaxID=3154541 RepID=UPI003327C838
MGLITGLLTLPLAPVRGVVWAAEQVKQQAEQQYYDPALIQRQIADVDDAYAAGELSDSERDRLHDELLSRLFEANRRRRGKEM